MTWYLLGMGFSEKMRDSLGAEGARLEVHPPATTIAAGATASISVLIVGGTKPAAVDALVVRLFEAHRHWTDPTGATIPESDPRDRRGLVPQWSKVARSEQRIAVGTTIEPGQRHEIAIELAIPDGVESTSASCNHTVHVQADIKGQIDPTGLARITIG